MFSPFIFDNILDNIQISCVEIDGTKVYVGAKDGVLIRFRIEDGGGKWSLIDTHKAFVPGGQSILSMKFVKFLNLLLISTEKKLFIVNPQTLQMVNQLSLDSGLFCVHTAPFTNPDTGISQISTKIILYQGKQSLSVFEWIDDEYSRTFAFSIDSEISNLHQMSQFNNECILISSRVGFFTLDINSKQVTNIFKKSLNVKHSSWCKISNEELLVSMDNQAYFITNNSDPSPSRNYQILCSKDIIDMVYIYPYVLCSLEGSNSIEVIWADDGNLAKSIFFSNRATNIQFASVKGLVCVYAYSKDCVNEIKSIPFSKQIQSLTDENRFEEAIKLHSLISIDEEKSISLNQILIQYLIYSFKSKHYKRFFDLATQLKLTPLNIILKFYPTLMSEGFKNLINRILSTNQASVEIFNKDMIKDLKQLEIGNGAVEELVLYLSQERSLLLKKIDGSSQSLNKDYQFSKSEQKQTSATFVTFNSNKSVRKAKLQVITQVDENETFSEHDDELNLMIIETTLLHAYLLLKRITLAQSLIRVSKRLNIEESESVLQRFDRKDDLVNLYKSYGLHEKSCQLFLKDKQYVKLSQYLFEIDKSENMDVFVKYFSITLTLDDESISFKSIADHFNYQAVSLKELSTSVQLEMDSYIFKIIDILQQSHTHLLLMYYMYLVFELGISNSDIHDGFVSLLIKIVSEAISQSDNQLKNDQLEQCIEVIKSLDYFKSSLLDNDVKIIRTFLMIILTISKCYRPDKLIFKFPGNLAEEKALVFGRIGQHRSALGIYINDLRDHQLARQYCSTYFTQDRNVFQYLVDIYLDNVVTDPSIEQQLIDLLDSEVYKLDTQSTLMRLQNSIKIRDLKNFINLSFQSKVKQTRQLQLNKSLAKANINTLLIQKCLIESNRILIDNYTMCSYCKKRLGDTNLFAAVRFGNDVRDDKGKLVKQLDGQIVVHYSCYETMSKQKQQIQQT